MQVNLLFGNRRGVAFWWVDQKRLGEVRETTKRILIPALRELKASGIALLTVAWVVQQLEVYGSVANNNLLLKRAHIKLIQRHAGNANVDLKKVFQVWAESWAFQPSNEMLHLANFSPRARRLYWWERRQQDAVAMIHSSETWRICKGRGQKYHRIP